MRRNLTKTLWNSLVSATRPPPPQGNAEQVWQGMQNRPLYNKVLTLLAPENFTGEGPLVRYEAGATYSLLFHNAKSYQTVGAIQGLLVNSLAAVSSPSAYSARLSFILQKLDSPQGKVQPTYYAIGPFREMIEGSSSTLSTQNLFDLALPLWLSHLSALQTDNTITTEADIAAIHVTLTENLRTLFTSGAWLDQAVLDHYLEQLPHASTQCIMPVSFYNHKIENKFYNRNIDTEDIRKLGSHHCFIPVYYRAHYILLEIVNTQNNTDVYVYNSMPAINTEPVQENIRAAIAHFFPAKNITFYTPPTPLQTNSDDCGYFVAWFVEQLLKNRTQLHEYGKLSGGHTFFNIQYMQERMQFTLAGHRAALPPLQPPTPCDLKKESMSFSTYWS